MVFKVSGKMLSCAYSKGWKNRSITLVPDSSTIKTDKNRSATPGLCVNTASKRMAYPINVEDDSSYEDEFT